VRRYVATIGRAHTGEGLRADRERAMLCVAHETMARRSELVALDVRDIDCLPNSTGQALIRGGKTDAEGRRRVAYLSRETVRWQKIWLEHSKVGEGPIFRRLIGRDQIGEALHSGSIAPIFKRVAQWIGMPARFMAEVSGHSTQVGAAQDLAELDIDLAAITQAGGWVLVHLGISGHFVSCRYRILNALITANAVF
jgi:integrase